MEKEDVATLAQLFTGMKDIIDKLEDAQKSKNLEEFSKAKNELLNLQKQVDQLL